MKVFIDLHGKFYKAEEAKDVSHAHKVLVSEDFLRALPDDGTAIDLLEVDAKVHALKNQ